MNHLILGRNDGEVVAAGDWSAAFRPPQFSRDRQSSNTQQRFTLKRPEGRAPSRRHSALTCLFTLATMAGMFFGVGCATTSVHSRHAIGEADCCKKELTAAAPVSDKSLYQLDSSWTNDQSAALQLGSLHGRPQIVTMFFAECEFACPILVHDMKRIEAALPENVRTNVGFVLVSFDSERDTPAALVTYRKIHELPANWTLLRGAPDDVLELAALLGVKYKKDLRGQFAHSNLITVLDPNGEIVMQQTGLNGDVAPTVATLRKLLEQGGR